MIAAADRDTVDAHLGGGEIDQPLRVIIGFRPARPPIGTHQRGVGEHAFGRHFEQRHAIDAHRVLHEIERRHERRDRAQIRAHIAVAGKPQRQESSLLVQRQLARELVIAAVMIRHEALEAIRGPFHRAA